MRYIEGGRQHGVEVVDVLAVPHDAVAVRDVEVARHLVHLHTAPDIAAFPRIDGVEGHGSVALALGAVAQDAADVPLLGLVRPDQLVAGVAASAEARQGGELFARVNRRKQSVLAYFLVSVSAP